MDYPYEATLTCSIRRTVLGFYVFQGDSITIVAHEPQLNRLYPFRATIIVDGRTDTVRLKEGEFKRVYENL